MKYKKNIKIFSSVIRTVFLISFLWKMVDCFKQRLKTQIEQISVWLKTKSGDLVFRNVTDKIYEYLLVLFQFF